MRILAFSAAILKRPGFYGILRTDVGWRFFGLWMLFFAAILMALYSLGFVPRGVAEIGDKALSVASDKEENNSAPFIGAIAQAKPRIIVPKIGVNANIVFPESADIDILNDALTKGVVHYPGSARPGETGNVFLFGHSTGLKVVNNKAYAVFNNLSELKPEDIVRLRYSGSEHWYKVLSVKVVKAEEALVDLDAGDGSRRLTLSTCRVFGAKEERYVVEAEFVKSYPLWSYYSAAGTSS